jgi:hypothetical protein
VRRGLEEDRMRQVPASMASMSLLPFVSEAV